MKPRFETIDKKKRGDSLTHRQARSFPLTDCNYQSIALGRYNGGRADHSTGSFLSISRDYFRNEARWSYAAELLLFAVIIAIAAVPLVNGAKAILHFFGLPPAA